MNLAQYLASPGALSPLELCRRAGIKNPDQLRQWRFGYAGRRPEPRYCLAIERATEGAVTRRDLRPDDAHLIWPDIAAPTQEAAHG